jgi:hypothetical protein
MEICRSRFIAHVLTNAADAGLYMNVSGIIAIIHFSMAHASYATAYFDVKNTGGLTILMGIPMFVTII